MNVGYLIHQAERPMSEKERRVADIRRGEVALALSRLLRIRRVVLLTKRPRRVAAMQGHAASRNPRAARACLVPAGQTNRRRVTTPSPTSPPSHRPNCRPTSR